MIDYMYYLTDSDVSKLVEASKRKLKHKKTKTKKYFCRYCDHIVFYKIINCIFCSRPVEKVMVS